MRIRILPKELVELMRSVSQAALLYTVLSLVMLQASAETSYVSDELSINLRSGTSNAHKIIRLLKSGTKVEVIGRSDNGYSNVRTEDGETGWVLSRFLSSEPSARDRLQALEKKHAALNEDFEREVEKRLQGMKIELSELRRTAASQIQLSRDNKRLREALTEQSAQQEKLLSQNARLQDQNKRKWFITGASVTLGSLFLGLIIPRIPWRKRRRWDEL